MRIVVWRAAYIRMLWRDMVCGIAALHGVVHCGGAAARSVKWHGVRGVLRCGIPYKGVHT